MLIGNFLSVLLVIIMEKLSCFVIGRITKNNFMNRNSNLNNKIPSVPQLALSITESIVQCTAICLSDDDCTIIFFNRQYRECRTYDLSLAAVQVNIQTQHGWQIYHTHFVCPTDEGYSYDSIIDRCIKGVNDKKNYEDARLSCLEDGAALAKIDNNEMWLFVKSVLAFTNADNIYVQGELDNYGVWRYDDGTAIDFIVWGIFQPSGKNIQNLDLWKQDNYRFHDVTGTFSYGYACEIYLK